MTESMTESMTETDLFSPVQVGPLTLANRIVMAPLTRSRAGAGDAPGPMNATYYAQRATAGLIISEATNITQQGKGYAWTPGIYTDAQVAGWRLVTDAVHQAGGRIFCQLWHVGRISHPSLQEHGALPVAPSSIKPQGQAFTETGFQPHVTPRALRTDELPGIVDQYRHATRCAMAAGFDGVEIHAANGYLLDQFLRSSTNMRTDLYGGSLDNRLRLPLKVAQAVCATWSPDRVGIRIGPGSPANDISDADPQTTFGTFVERLNQYGLVYVHVIEGATGGPRDAGQKVDFAALRRAFHGLYMANNGYTRDLALQARADNSADLICFGRPFIANPDLVARLRNNTKLAEIDPATLYGGDSHGYTDYPPAEAK
jgi:N-ethylmaleimide reductase